MSKAHEQQRDDDQAEPLELETPRLSVCSSWLPPTWFLDPAIDPRDYMVDRDAEQL